MACCCCHTPPRLVPTLRTGLHQALHRLPAAERWLHEQLGSQGARVDPDGERDPQARGLVHDAPL